MCCRRARLRCSSWPRGVIFRTISRWASESWLARNVRPIAPRPISARSRKSPSSSPTSGKSGAGRVRRARLQSSSSASWERHWGIVGGTRPRPRPRPLPGGGKPPRRRAGPRPRPEVGEAARNSSARGRSPRSQAAASSLGRAGCGHVRSGQVGRGRLERPLRPGRSPGIGAHRVDLSGPVATARPRRRPVRQVVQDAADAALVQAGPRGDLGQGKPLRFSGAARGGPAGRGRASGPRARSAARPRWAGAGCSRTDAAGESPQRLLARQRVAVLAATVEEPVPRQPGEEGLEVGAVLKRQPDRQPLQDVGPDRLHDVHRVELGPQRRPELAADQHPEVRLVGPEDLLGGGHVAAVQPLEEPVQRLVAHTPSRPQRAAASGETGEALVPLVFGPARNVPGLVDPPPDHLRGGDRDTHRDEARDPSRRLLPQRRKALVDLTELFKNLVDRLLDGRPVERREARDQVGPPRAEVEPFVRLACGVRFRPLAPGHARLDGRVRRRGGFRDRSLLGLKVHRRGRPRPRPARG